MRASPTTAAFSPVLPTALMRGGSDPWPGSALGGAAR